MSRPDTGVPGARMRYIHLYLRERSGVPFNCSEYISRADCSQYYRIYHTYKECLRERTGNPNSTPAVPLYEPCVARLQESNMTAERDSSRLQTCTCVSTQVYGSLGRTTYLGTTAICILRIQRLYEFPMIITINSDHWELFTKNKEMPYVDVMYVRTDRHQYHW
jgi:hypothetical protein